MKKLFIPLILSLLMLTLALPASAGYAVHPQYPENQRPERQGHFNLHVTPGHTQSLNVAIENFGDETIHIEVTANAAVTNTNGIIEYAPHPQGVYADNDLLPDFSQVVTIAAPLISIAPGATEIAAFDVSMPDTPFAGSLVGGLHFVESIQAQPGQENDGAALTGSTGLTNRMAYVVALVLRQDDHIMPPAFELLQAVPDMDFSDAIRITLKNTSARISSLRNFTVQIYDEPGVTFPIETLVLPHVQMAPYAEPSLRLWRNTRDPIASGTYHVLVTFECEDALYLLETPLSII